MIRITTSRIIAPLPERKRTPERIGGFAFLGCSTNSRVSRLWFPYRRDPSQDQQTAYNACTYLATITALTCWLPKGWWWIPQSGVNPKVCRPRQD
jgi:hypothetical protein